MQHSLKFFILQAESKRLYKTFMKLTRKIESKQERRDMRRWICDDFKLNKNSTDEFHIKSQHIRAQRALEELEMSIDLSRAKNE